MNLTTRYDATSKRVFTLPEYLLFVGDDGAGGNYSALSWEELPEVILPYDSAPDTLKHIKRVNQLLGEAAQELIRRGIVHDDSKLQSPEKEVFDEYTPKLAGSTYGTPEYFEQLKGMKPALDHHYAVCSHHPEHYSDGIQGMDLYDLLELVLDWKAASERHTNGNILKSLEQQRTRFFIGDQLMAIIENHVQRYLLPQ